MTDNNHPITPPPELAIQWSIESEREHQPTVACSLVSLLATKAARWGADQELEACCEWLRSSLPGYDKHYADYLHTARRPKPPSLKEQALQVLANADGADHPVVATVLTADEHALIRRALESLPD